MSEFWHPDKTKKQIRVKIKFFIATLHLNIN